MMGGGETTCPFPKGAGKKSNPFSMFRGEAASPIKSWEFPMDFGRVEARRKPARYLINRAVTLEVFRREKKLENPGERL